MITDPSRRRFLRTIQALGILAASSWLRIDRAAEMPNMAGIRFGPEQPFTFERLRRRARWLAKRPWHPASSRYSSFLDQITYDVYQEIRYRSTAALWRDNLRPYPIEFFHLGRFARKPVRIYALNDGRARQILYNPLLFNYGKSGLGDTAPADLGFAGFRIMNAGNKPGDWLACMGASYFRSSGTLNQYGLSARGIAVNTAVPGENEEFPDFTAFWLEEPNESGEVVIYALLDGPSVTGAYRMIWHSNRQAIIADIEAELILRREIEQLGIAPLTSMYWYSETNHRSAPDWHPEIHDSDGLALWTGSGEHLWIPLNNPPRVQTNSYLDYNPKGFGLLQRDRDFQHYLDDSTYYDRRPSVWVEPKEGWGAGSVVLVEIPTTDETSDNIVAFWKPALPARSGSIWNLHYRLYWTDREPFLSGVAHVAATRLGQPGIPGQHAPRVPNGRKFVIEFTGGPLENMPQRFDLKAVVTASQGHVDNIFVLKILGTTLWRAQFDLYTENEEPVVLRCYLQLGKRILSETWMYQYLPGSYGL